jgi:CHAT domain-containing protein
MTALVYTSLRDHLYRWRVTNGGVTVDRVPVTRAALDALVQQHVDDLRAARPSRSAAQLATLLLPHDLDADPGAQLAILPDGPLHRLPFASLPHPGTGRPLVADLAPVVTPSLTILKTAASMSRATSRRAVLVGYGAARPDAGLAQLPAVDREIDAIRPYYRHPLVLRAESATADRILTAMAEADVIHIAGHAVADEVFPAESRLFVAPSAGDSGELRPEKLAGVRLPGGSVVVLSACDTFAGRVYRGEGPMALARPFLAAGASSVIATLWPVTDRAAEAVARAIHEGLSAGLSPAAAVAAAVRTLSGTHPDAQAFQVCGSGGSSAHADRPVPSVLLPAERRNEGRRGAIAEHRTHGQPAGRVVGTDAPLPDPGQRRPVAPRERLEEDRDLG